VDTLAKRSERERGASGPGLAREDDDEDDDEDEEVV
jgi:hypothetical protein